MAVRIADTVRVELDTTWDTYARKLATGERAFDRSMSNMTRSAATAEARINKSSDRIAQGLRTAATSIAAGVSVQAVGRMADSYVRFTNQLRVAGVEGARLATVQQSLLDMAQRNGVELETLGTLYGRVAQAATELGATQADLLKFTSGVAAAIRVQGGNAADSQGALLQLSQALGGAIVRAEEFNSINEGARPILQAVANGIDRFGGSVSKLRAEVIEGKVTSREFYQGFLEGSAQLEAQAARSTLTTAQAFVVLRNALTAYVGQSDQAVGASAVVGGAIRAIADNIDVIIPALGVLATLIGSRYVVALTAAAAGNMRVASSERAKLAAELSSARATEASIAAELRAASASGARTAAVMRLQAALQAAQARSVAAAAALNAASVSARAFGGAMALVGGPAGLALTAITVALGSFAIEAANAQRASEQLQQTIDASNNAIKEADGYLAKANSSVNQLGGEAITAGGKVDKFAGAVGRAAEQLYNLANAKRAAALADLEAQRAQVSTELAGQMQRAPDQRRQDPFGKKGSMAEEWRSGITFLANEARNIWTGGASDAQIAADISKGWDQLRRLDDAISRMQSSTAEDFADEALAAAAGGTTTDGKGGKGKGYSGPSVSELRMLAQLDAARERGDHNRVRSLEDALELTARIEEYTRAGLSADQARLTAAEDMAAITAARAEAFQREQDRMARAVDIEVARTAENFAQARLLENQADLQERIESYLRAGLTVQEAATRAAGEQAKLEEARSAAAARRRADMARDVALQVAQIDGADQVSQALEDQAFLREQALRYQEQELGLVEATAQAERDLATIQAARQRAQARYLEDLRAEHDLRVAESRGDRREANRIRTRREAGDRVRDRVRNGQNADDAAREVTAEMTAEQVAELQGQFRTTFRDGVMAALEGDLGGFWESFIKDRTAAALEEALNTVADLGFDLLKGALPQLFPQIADTTSAAAEGAAKAAAEQAAAAAVAASITTAGVTAAASITTAGTAIATAIAAAGASAAAAIAAASATASSSDGVMSFLSSLGASGGMGGGKAAGGRVYGGVAYPVNEGKGGSEWFVPDGPGVIVPQEKMGGGGGGAVKLGVTLENKTGTPMRVVDRGGEGAERRLSLEPVVDDVIMGAARSGTLGRAERQKRQPVKRG